MTWLKQFVECGWDQLPDNRRLKPDCHVPPLFTCLSRDTHKTPQQSLTVWSSHPSLSCLNWEMPDYHLKSDWGFEWKEKGSGVICVKRMIVIVLTVADRHWWIWLHVCSNINFQWTNLDKVTWAAHFRYFDISQTKRNAGMHPRQVTSLSLSLCHCMDRFLLALNYACISLISFRIPSI